MLKACRALFLINEKKGDNLNGAIILMKTVASCVQARGKVIYISLIILHFQATAHTLMCLAWHIPYRYLINAG
jgi:hypothetical protein